MFDEDDERGASGWTLCAAALARARGGGTLALNISKDWNRPSLYRNLAPALRRARDDQHWNIHAVPSLDGLVEFARAFSRQKFGPATELVPLAPS